MKDDATRAASLLEHVGAAFAIERGRPLPLGASAQQGGVNYSLFSRHGTAVTLDLFPPAGGPAFLSIPLDPRFNRTGDVWHVFVRDLDPRVCYGWSVAGGTGDPRLNRFAPEVSLIDPYARGIVGAEQWGPPAVRRAALPETEFAWGLDQPLNVPLADSIIYELHVRGFTKDQSSGVAAPGTFLGLTEKIPYLKTPRRDRGGVAADQRVRRDREPALQPAHGRAAPELLGLQLDRLLRAEGVVRLRHATRCASSRKWSSASTPRASR